MQEGESELGGLKIPHGNTTPPSSTPGPQPAASAATNSEPAPSPTPTPNPQPATSPVPQPNPLPVTPPQVSTNPTPAPQPQPAPSPTNHFSNRSVVRQPFPSPIPNSPTQDTTFNNFDNNIILSPAPQPKKSKKWLVITIIFLLAAVGLGAGILISFGSNLFQSEPTTAEYENLYEELIIYDIEAQDFQDFIRQGLDKEINFYQLFMLNYIIERENINYLFDMGSLGGHEITIPEPIVAGNNDEYVNNLNNYLENIQKLKISDSAKNAAKEIQELIPEYANISGLFSEIIHTMRETFMNENKQNMEKFLDDYNFSIGVKYVLLNYKEQYDQISTSWEKCQDNPAREGCWDSLSTSVLEAMEEDFNTVDYIFNKFINSEEMEFITEFGSKIYDLAKEIGGYSLEN